VPLLAVPGKSAVAGVFEPGLSGFAYGFSSSFVFVIGRDVSDAGMPVFLLGSGPELL
jgi:hypothetical protein